MGDGSPKKKILVVEDDLDMLNLVEIRLSSEGFDVVSALTGKDALAKFESEAPDLVLTDVILPDMDGFDVCRRIKQELNPKVKVLMYTGKIEQVDVEVARQSGADELVLKSGDLKQVTEKIHEFLG